jgi:hypothetical protein
MNSKRLRINLSIVDQLKRALRAARLRQCTIDKEHQDAMREYLEIYVAKQIDDALKTITQQSDAAAREGAAEKYDDIRHRLRITRACVYRLEFALTEVRLATCPVPKQHQEAMRGYLERWVAKPLAFALEEITQQSYQYTVWTNPSL